MSHVHNLNLNVLSKQSFKKWKEGPWCSLSKHWLRKGQPLDSILTTKKQIKISEKILMISTEHNQNIIILPGMVAHTFKASSHKSESGGSLWAQVQPGLHSELQKSWIYIVRPCLKIPTIYIYIIIMYVPSLGGCMCVTHVYICSLVYICMYSGMHAYI